MDGMQLPIYSLLQESNLIADTVFESANPESIVPLNECLRNHSICVGSYSLDDWIEFMTCSTDAFKCPVCSFPRNFNSQEHECHDRRDQTATDLKPVPLPKGDNPTKRKRFRTRFSREQTQKMNEYGTRLGWKISKKDEAAVQDFCNEISIRRKVFQRWLQNRRKMHTFVPESSKADGIAQLNKCLENHSTCIGGYSVEDWTQFVIRSVDPFNRAVCGCPGNFYGRGDGTFDRRDRTFDDMRQVSSSAKCNPIKMKRVRTKFSEDQIEKMNEYAIKLGWKISKEDQAAVQEFCNQISVERKVFGQWLQNKKKNRSRGKKVA